MRSWTPGCASGDDAARACDRLRAIAGHTVAPDGGSEAERPARMTREAAEKYRELAEGAPPDVAAAAGTLAGSADALAGLMEEYSATLHTPEAPERMDAVVGAPEVAEAGRAVEDFALEGCGMDPKEIPRWGGSFGPPR